VLAVRGAGLSGKEAGGWGKFAVTEGRGWGITVSMNELTRDDHGHAAVYGSPGTATRFSGLIRAIWPLFLGTAIGGYLLRSLLPYPAVPLPVAGIAMLVLVGAMAMGIHVSRTRVESYLVGARGEEWVARQLALLPAGYAVFNSAEPLQQAQPAAIDYDHLVVGPSGIYVIETKNWRETVSVEDGKVLYNGQEPSRPPLEQVKQTANALRRMLAEQLPRATELIPVLCFAGETPVSQPTGTAGVVVCNLRDLNQFILENSDAPLADADRTAVTESLKKLYD
jgi:hypothetical protein